jgi:hypothetical protein
MHFCWSFMVQSIAFRPAIACSFSCCFVRPEGVYHQWRKEPSGELSIGPVADERLGRATERAEAS